jgi:hypothetical protein
VIRECAPAALDFTQRRCRYKGRIVDEVAWAKNRRKSKVRAKVEHVFQVMKVKFGFVKVRYRGLKKNAHSRLGLKQQRHFVLLRFFFHRHVQRHDLLVEHGHQLQQVLAPTRRLGF